MRHRMQRWFLVLVLLLGVLVLPRVPEASAEAGQADWAARLAEMDRALARGDSPAATAAWREAYVAAHVSGAWPGMLAVGDAALRAGRRTGDAQLFTPRARRAYLTGLLRARRHGSLDGVLAAADAFKRLGDRDVERQARSLAAAMVIRTEGDARRRARAQ